MNTDKKERKGSSAAFRDDMISMFAERDPFFLTPILDDAYDNETVALPTALIEYGDKGAGVLGLVIGQSNTGASDIAAFTATLKVYDIDGFQIGTDITQTIPLTPSGKSVMTKLNIAQNTVLRGHSISITGDIVCPADTTSLKVYLCERAPEEEVTVSDDGIATEATLAAINAKVPAQGQALAAASWPVVLPALQAADIKEKPSVQQTIIAASTTLTAGTTYYNGADSVNWIRVGQLKSGNNAAEGLCIHGLATVPNNPGDSLTMTVFGSNDPHATAASKVAHQTPFYDDRIDKMTMAYEVVIPLNSTAAEFAMIFEKFPWEWMYLKMVPAGHNATDVCAFMNAR